MTNKPNIEGTDKWEDSEKLARWLHERYEKHAYEEGWDTQESTKVDYEDLPNANKRVMRWLAADIQDYIISKARIEERNKLIDQIKRKCVAVDGSGKKDTYWEYFIKFLDSLLKEEGK